MADTVYADRVNMKKPKLNSLALQCPVWLALLLAPFCAAAADAPATVATAATVADNSGAVVMNITPEALTNSNPVVKINMARWFTGSTFIKELPNGDLQQIVFQNRTDIGPFEALMEDDATTPVPFPTGVTSLVIDIGGTRTVQSFGFFSFTMRGTLDLYYSDSTEMLKTVKIDPTEWKSANVHTEINSKQVVSINLGAIDAHYVMAVFTLSEPGTISPLSMLGVIATDKNKKAASPDQETDDQKKGKVVNPEDLVEFDYANAAYGTKVTDVIGGKVNEAQNVLGADPKQALVLGNATIQATAAPATAATSTPATPALAAAPAPATATTPATTPEKKTDTNNIFVVDMGKEHDINKVGLLFKTEGSGQFDFYLLKQLPTKTVATPNGAPANPAGTGPTAWLDQPEPVLLAASEGSLAEALILAQTTPDAPAGGGDGSIKPVDYLPADFFKNTKPTFSQAVTGGNSDNKITQNYDNNLQIRFALIRWVPTDASQPGVQVFKVNLIGKVPVDNFSRASKSNINLGPPSVSPPAFAIVGTTPPPGQTTDPSPPTPPAPPSNPNPSPSQATSSNAGGGRTGGGGDTGTTGGGGGDPTVPPVAPQPSITP